MAAKARDVPRRKLTNRGGLFEGYSRESVRCLLGVAYGWVRLNFLTSLVGTLDSFYTKGTSLFGDETACTSVVTKGGLTTSIVRQYRHAQCRLVELLSPQRLCSLLFSVLDDRSFIALGTGAECYWPNLVPYA